MLTSMRGETHNGIRVGINMSLTMQVTGYQGGPVTDAISRVVVADGGSQLRSWDIRKGPVTDLSVQGQQIREWLTASNTIATTNATISNKQAALRPALR